MKQKVVIGLSGGVDSSVAAYLLKERGYDVVGLFMRNWHDTTGTLAGDCPWYDDQMFAELVAKRLDIPFHYVDLSGQYRQRVVDYMFSEYEKGRTPNPDVLCNREIKFDVFLKEALKLGADYVATGHYCRKGEVEVDGRTVYRLLAGADPNKDQSYFLCQLSQEQLRYAMFPIGDMLKPEVRRIAEEQKLATAKRKDSQGICFVGKVDLPTFLQQKLTARTGDIVEIPASWPGYYVPLPEVMPPDVKDAAALEVLAAPFRYTPADGAKVGEHNGAHFYTIGQRKGLNVGGRPEPLFIIATDTVRNVIYVGQGQSHPGLYRRGLHVRPEEMHWIRPDLAPAICNESFAPAIPEAPAATVSPATPSTPPAPEARRYGIRIRYRQPLQQGTLYATARGGYVVFDQPQRGVTPGQFAAWYADDELVGSGVIDE